MSNHVTILCEYSSLWIVLYELTHALSNVQPVFPLALLKLLFRSCTFADCWDSYSAIRSLHSTMVNNWFLRVLILRLQVQFFVIIDATNLLLLCNVSHNPILSLCPCFSIHFCYFQRIDAWELTCGLAALVVCQLWENSTCCKICRRELIALYS